MPDGSPAPRPRRVARSLGALLVLGCVLVGVQLFRARPAEVTLAVAVGPAASSVRRLELGFVDGRDHLARTIDLRFGAEGAPPSLRRSTQLRDGRYRVAVRLTDASGAARTSERSLTVDGDGTYPLNLEP